MTRILNGWNLKYLENYLALKITRNLQEKKNKMTRIKNNYSSK